MTRMRAPIGLVTLTLLVAATHAGAQRSDSLAAAAGEQGAGSLACATAMHASSTPAAPTRAASTSTSSRTLVDTTITLSIADRTWQRDDYEGGIALGTGAARGERSRWSACAGVAVHLGHVAATLHNVRGVIHLRADPAALRRLGAASPDSLSQGSGSTPPAVPPRR